MAMDAPANKTDVCNHAKNVRSLEKNTLGSTFTGACRGFTIDAVGGFVEDSNSGVFRVFWGPNKKEKKPPLFDS
jgi:hypothetical protein